MPYNLRLMSASRTEKIFTRIYARNSWGDAESRSGTGSNIARTGLLRPRLTRLLLDLGVRSILDLPCGDFNWMRLTELPGIEYTGGDIVTGLIEENNSLYAQPGRRFLRLDMICDALPKADLIFCRDGLVHFSFSDIARALRAMKESGSTYLLTTTFTAHRRNKNIATGEWRPLNLDLEPFHFPAPLQTIADGPRLDGTAPDKALALHRLEDLSDRIGELEKRPRSIAVPLVVKRGLGKIRARLRKSR